MPTLLVRDVMVIGVPVCRDTETCATVVTRLTGEVVVALDEDGMACGWLTREKLMTHLPSPVAEVIDEDIPTVSPDIAVEVALQIMRDRGVEHLFLMHAWPGEPRPSAMISRRAIERRLTETTHASD